MCVQLVKQTTFAEILSFTQVCGRLIFFHIFFHSTRTLFLRFGRNHQLKLYRYKNAKMKKFIHLPLSSDSKGSKESSRGGGIREASSRQPAPASGSKTEASWLRGSTTGEEPLQPHIFNSTGNIIIKNVTLNFLDCDFKNYLSLWDLRKL